jgi:AraC family transcriptional regulator
MAVDGAVIEMCVYPEVRAETIRIVEPQPVLMLGLSRLLIGSEGRIAGDPRRPFARFGGLALRPAGVPLEIHVGQGAFDTIRIRFEERRIAAVLGKQPLSDAVLAACFDMRVPSVEDAMLRLAVELERPAPDSPAVAEALVSLLVLDLARHIEAAARHARRDRGGLSARALRMALGMIEAAGPTPSLDAIAEQCGLSRHHFIRCFRQSTGIGPGAAIRRGRIERAKILLIEDDRTVQDIAHALGYAGAPSFSAAFRQETGRSPGAWRALMR